jgi:hypothetical protein
MRFMILTRWATFDLRHGDLTALAEIAKGWDQSTDSRMARLKRRQFVSVGRDGQIRVTLRGHLALMVRRVIKR